MICVSIGRSRHKHMLAEHKHLVEEGAELVELRLDYISSRVNLKRLIEKRPSPVIITVRREIDGGKFEGSEDDRMMLLREAIVLGVDYVDLEEDIADKVPRYGDTKRIVSYHNFRNTPDNLEELHAEMAAKDADVVKLATMAQNPMDNIRMLELVRNSDVPTVGMCMGDIGTPSRILGARFGAPFTYATFHHERALAPGQLSFQQMTEIYRYARIGPETTVYGVIADPIGHSLSPQIHNASLEEAGIDAVYVPLRVPADSLGDFMANMQRLGVEGLSVTIPHKETITKHLTKATQDANGIKAVNTVVRRGDDLVGCNTDCGAAMDSLEHVLGEVGAEPSPLADKRVLLLGSGGVARAIAFGLRKRGAKITIAGRTRERAERLAKEFDGRAIDWPARHNSPCDVLINCSPIGMHPNVDHTPYTKTHLKPSVVVFDTVYNPESTLLIKEAREQGCTVITGVDMFVRQAALQFLLFTEKEPPTELMRETLKRAIGPVRY
ncbi:MAG: shikimate dehydrogenase [Planctomycetota bacterium]